MCAQLAQHRLRHPGFGEEHVLRFARTLEEVLDTRQSVDKGLAEDGLLLLQVHLPVAPLHAEDGVKKLGLDGWEYNSVDYTTRG